MDKYCRDIAVGDFGQNDLRYLPKFYLVGILDGRLVTHHDHRVVEVVAVTVRYGDFQPNHWVSAAQIYLNSGIPSVRLLKLGKQHFNY